MFKLSFKTENSAFDEGFKKEEITRILNKVICQIEENVICNKIIDINGNKIGEWEIE
jgi:hypothetical protein